MDKKELTIRQIPCVLYGAPAKQVFVYVHGKCGCKEEAEAFAGNVTSRGYQVLAMNYRCHMGEVDIVAKDGEYLCFVEVKYRTNYQLGSPQHAVNMKKQKTTKNMLGQHRLDSVKISQHQVYH